MPAKILTPRQRASLIAWAKARAMLIIPRVAARRSFADLLQNATPDQLLAVIAVLADREVLAGAARAEREKAQYHGREVPESIAELAREWERVSRRRRRAAQPKPAGVLAGIRRDEQAARVNRRAA